MNFQLLAASGVGLELVLGLDPPTGVAVAEVGRRELLKLGLVGFERGLAEDVDPLGHGGFVPGACHRRFTAEHQRGDPECKHAQPARRDATGL